jgi:hypothetical protein
MGHPPIFGRHFSDLPRLGKLFWTTAKLTLPEPMFERNRNKDRLTIRVDHDVVPWIKKHGKGYQARINAILLSYYGSPIQQVSLAVNLDVDVGRAPRPLKAGLPSRWD